MHTSQRADMQGSSGVEILSVATEKCLNVEGGSRDAGASVQQVRCHGGVAQRWRAHVATVPGHVYFQNDHSGLCLDVRQGGPADGTLQQYGCHYGDNQLFRLESVGSATGGTRIVARSSGQCLDVPGGEPRDNLTIQQWPCHGRSNQQWIYAEPGTYRYPLVVSPIARLDFLLQEERTYRFELGEFAIGGAPVLHLWSERLGAVAFTTGSPPPVSRLTHRVPVGGGGVYRLFVHAAPSTGSGTGALTVFEDDRVLQMRANVPFGGTVVDALPSTMLQPYTYETALATDGVEDPYLLALDGSGRLVAHDDNSGAGPNARIAAVVGVAHVVVGSIDALGAVTLLVNDAFRDQDGDGLGNGLLRRVRIESRRPAKPCDVHSFRGARGALDAHSNEDQHHRRDRCPPCRCRTHTMSLLIDAEHSRATVVAATARALAIRRTLRQWGLPQSSPMAVWLCDANARACSSFSTPTRWSGCGYFQRQCELQPVQEVVARALRIRVESLWRSCPVRRHVSCLRIPRVHLA